MEPRRRNRLNIQDIKFDIFQNFRIGVIEKAGWFFRFTGYDYSVMPERSSPKYASNIKRILLKFPEKSSKNPKFSNGFMRNRS